MHHLVGETQTADGVRLRTQTWLPTGEPRAILAFAHGIAEHAGRYVHVGEVLTDAGYALHMADLRGHGESPGKRGHVASFEEYREDFATIVQGAWDVAPEAPYFIGGHSLGGLIALNAALDRPMGARGLVVSGPGLGLAFEPPTWQVALGKVLSTVAPGVIFPLDLEHTALSHDPEVVEAYESDPQVHNQISARCYTETIRAQQATMANAGRLEMPVLILHGGADRLTSVEASRTFYEQAGASDKTLKVYDGLYHEIFNEPDNEQVLADVITWMGEHI